MTDARIPERYLSDRRVLRLSDRGFRVYVLALTWSVANRSDGVIEDDDIVLMPGNFAAGDMTEIVTAGLAKQQGARYLLLDFEDTQTMSRELQVLENVRRRERLKKARQRAAAAGKGADDEGTVPGDTHGGSSPGTAQEGRQEGRQVLEPPPTEVSSPSQVNEYGVGFCSSEDCSNFEKLGPDSLCSECVIATSSTIRAVS